MMTYDEAISVLAHRFQSPTVGATEEYVEALHAIIADVIDSCALAIESYVLEPSHLPAYQAPALAAIAAAMIEDVVGTVEDYVVNHYGEEEFGL